jgi:glucan phosphoethanolaminetransferase (alkaline phosphatase superfamily)
MCFSNLFSVPDPLCAYLTVRFVFLIVFGTLACCYSCCVCMHDNRTVRCNQALATLCITALVPEAWVAAIALFFVVITILMYIEILSWVIIGVCCVPVMITLNSAETDGHFTWDFNKEFPATHVLYACIGIAARNCCGSNAAVVPLAVPAAVPVAVPVAAPLAASAPNFEDVVTVVIMA